MAFWPKESGLSVVSSGMLSSISSASSAPKICSTISTAISLIAGPLSKVAIGRDASTLDSTEFLSSIAIRESIPSVLSGLSVSSFEGATPITLAISFCK